jgi:hypothetical protein
LIGAKITKALELETVSRLGLPESGFDKPVEDV